MHLRRSQVESRLAICCHISRAIFHVFIFCPIWKYVCKMKIYASTDLCGFALCMLHEWKRPDMDPLPPSPSLSLRKIREELAFMWNGCGIAYFWIADQINMRVYDYDTRNSLFLCSAFYVCLAIICCGFSLFTPSIFIIRNY